VRLSHVNLQSGGKKTDTARGTPRRKLLLHPVRPGYVVVVLFLAVCLTTMSYRQSLPYAMQNI